VPVRGLPPAVAIASKGGHACALTSGGSIWCWGFNDSGQLGTGSTEHSFSPVRVRGF
jgi:alpha-tubulin suppressor-like RCC1 family protein